MGETATFEAVGEKDRATEQRPRLRLRLPWPGRTKTAPGPERDAATGEAESEPTPLAYRTFSPNIAPALTAVGGLLALIGGLGTWVRATELRSGATLPEQVTATMGYDDPEGMTIAVLGGVAILGSAAWLRRRPLFDLVPSLFVKVVPVVASVGVIVLAAWQLPLIDQQARQLALEARARVDFVAYHAGLGWGAWCLLAGALSLALGTFIGVLRELDVRKGFGDADREHL